MLRTEFTDHDDTVCAINCEVLCDKVWKFHTPGQLNKNWDLKEYPEALLNVTNKPLPREKF